MGLGYPLSIAISNGKTINSKVKFRRKEKARSSTHNTPLNLVLGYFPGPTRRWAFWMLVLIYFGEDVCHLIWGGNVNVLTASFSSVSLMKRLWTSICLVLLCWIGLCAMSIAYLLSHYKLIKIFFIMPMLEEFLLSICLLLFLQPRLWIWPWHLKATQQVVSFSSMWLISTQEQTILSCGSAIHNWSLHHLNRHKFLDWSLCLV